MGEHTPDQLNPRAVELALAALGAAIATDDDTASAALATIVTETGAPGLMDAIYVWCDTLITQAGPSAMFLDVEWADDETGHVIAPQDVPAEAQWAGRLLTARAEDDEETFVTLMRDLGTDPLRVADHVGALFDLVAVNLRRALDARRRAALS
ncbi:hypothetical protein [Nonomuraea basaltis]|uniref:hypothetical protein n=1 Tax=Nonomuraea basaltis TaxID=2495887 RepID=UPI00110C6ACB|nr:hypothetical protein [Nonomuraea basaltis]TMR90543.1 hypothetical protein EJK15_54860 [Nonomuraea basaltis]